MSFTEGGGTDPDFSLSRSPGAAARRDRLAAHHPPADVHLVSTTNVVPGDEKEVHPAIIDLLSQAIMEAHGGPGLFQKTGDFPTQTDPEYPFARARAISTKAAPHT